MGNCYLYVLRYNYSGNYYVGSTTADLENRMKKHLRENINKGTPVWSCKNKASKGFKYYWFDVNQKGDSNKNVDYNANLQSNGDCCENALEEKLREMVKEIKDCNINREVHVVGGCNINPEKYTIKGISPIYDSIDEKIEIYLKSLTSFKINIKAGAFEISYRVEGKYE